jgi:hypothetical protein
MQETKLLFFIYTLLACRTELILNYMKFLLKIGLFFKAVLFFRTEQQNQFVVVFSFLLEILLELW